MLVLADDAVQWAGMTVTAEHPRTPTCPHRPATRQTTGDRVFRALATVATSFSLAIVGITFVFLINESRPALESAGVWDFFTHERVEPDRREASESSGCSRAR